MSHLLFGSKFGILENLAADIWVMLYIPSLIVLPFFSYSHVFINIHDYSKYSICISYHWVKVLCLGFDLVPSWIVYDSKQMTYR